jgi:hypothetical protein
MTPISDMNFDDEVYDTKKHKVPLTKLKVKKRIANRATGIRGSKIGLNHDIT